MNLKQTLLAATALAVASATTLSLVGCASSGSSTLGTPVTVNLALAQDAQLIVNALTALTPTLPTADQGVVQTALTTINADLAALTAGTQPADTVASLIRTSVDDIVPGLLTDLKANTAITVVVTAIQGVADELLGDVVPTAPTATMVEGDVDPRITVKTWLASIKK